MLSHGGGFGHAGNSNGARPSSRTSSCVKAPDGRTTATQVVGGLAKAMLAADTLYSASVSITVRPSGVLAVRTGSAKSFNTRWPPLRKCARCVSKQLARRPRALHRAALTATAARVATRRSARVATKNRGGSSGEARSRSAAASCCAAGAARRSRTTRCCNAVLRRRSLAAAQAVAGVRSTGGGNSSARCAGPGRPWRRRAGSASGRAHPLPTRSPTSW